MQQNISSDKPVSKEEDDRFQRYNFSSRIAQRIKTAQNNDSVVIGVYGEWGEGKTSVMNFIEQELKTDSSIITLKFNPWRFTDETTLLISFFNSLATKVRESFPENISKNSNIISSRIVALKKKWREKKEPLKTDKETIGELIEKYGKVASIIRGAEITETIGKILSNVDIEELKKRLEKLLLESEKKIVIFIDDIDRLDKEEIYAIFRLVKLTADFTNTFYILSFDEEMVASAIGTRFGSGDKESGANFLEKIIQVPLKIPVAQPEALKKYCFKLVDKAILENNIEFNDNDARRFVSEFEENVLIRLKTPRLAIRYGNILSFSLPLLDGEVNLADLMLIEAIKIFYPSHYEFVKNNSHYFLSSYSSDSFQNNGDVESKKKELADHLKELGHELSKRENESIKSLLHELFPRLDEAFKNTFQHNGDVKWYKNKRIASPEYFNRYFSYTVLKGEVSDTSFDAFINSINELEESDILEKFKNLIELSSIDSLLYKLRTREEDFEWETSKKLALSIAILGSLLKENNSIFGRYQGSKPQAAIFIYQLLKKHENQDESFELAKELLTTASPFEFAHEIIKWLSTNNSNEEKIFTEIQYRSLWKVFIDRALKESGETPIFYKFPDIAPRLFRNWKKINEKKFEDYTQKTLGLEKKNVLDLLLSFTPVMYSSSHPEPYKSNFTKDQFDFFSSLFDKDYIYRLIMQNYGDIINEQEAKFNDFENVQNGINVMRQFIYYYLEEKAQLED